MGLFTTVALVANLCAFGAAQTAITVDLGTKHQRIDGFGVSQAFGRAKEFQNMTNTAMQKQALDLLFDTTTGAGLSIIRNRIGSVGGTSKPDSILPSSPGSPSGTPKYVWDGDDSGQVWFSKQAVSYGVSTIYADAWSAPGFMKTNGNEASGGYLCGTTGHTCSSGDWRQAYANLLVQYVKYYAQEGITVTHLGFLNEPEFTASYSSMLLSSDAKEAVSFIPTLSSTVKAANLTTKLTCCDAEGWGMQRTYTSALVSAGMEQYLSVITSHQYTGDPNSPLSTKLPAWLTEGAPSGAFQSTWYSNGGSLEGFAWAGKIATGILSANLSAYVFWEGFEIGQTQSESHLLDVKGSDVFISGIYYAFVQWSRWVRPGAVRVTTSGTISSVSIGAFQNVDGSVVLVFTNSGGSAQSAKVSVSGLTPTAAAAIVTDNSHKAASTTATLSGGAATVSIPAHGVLTLKLTSDSTGAAKENARSAESRAYHYYQG